MNINEPAGFGGRKKCGLSFRAVRDGNHGGENALTVSGSKASTSVTEAPVRLASASERGKLTGIVGVVIG